MCFIVRCRATYLLSYATELHGNVDARVANADNHHRLVLVSAMVFVGMRVTDLPLELVLSRPLAREVRLGVVTGTEQHCIELFLVALSSSKLDGISWFCWDIYRRYGNDTRGHAG